MENNDIDKSLPASSLLIVASKVCVEYSKKFSTEISLDLLDASRITYFVNGKIIYPEIAIRISKAIVIKSISDSIIDKLKDSFIDSRYDIRAIIYDNYCDIILSSKL